MLKIIVRGYLSGIALGLCAIFVLLGVATLIKWFPWMGFIFVVLSIAAVVMIINWAFSPD